MSAGAAPAAPRFLSKSINWAAGAVGVAGKEGAYNALLISKRKTGEFVIEDLGTHTKPWFAAVCHDVLFLKAAYDEGNTGLGGLEHAHVARPGSEQRLNFPLSSYTCQPPFWEALDSHDYGQLAVQLRCHRDLARVLFFGDTWDPALPRKWQQQQPQHKRQQAQQPLPQKQQPQPQQRATAAARQGAAALPPGRAAHEQAGLKQQAPADDAAAVQRQQQGHCGEGAPGSLPSGAAAAGARPAVKRVQPDWSSSSDDSGPRLAPGGPPPAPAASAAAVRRARGPTGPRPVVVSDSDSEERAPGVGRQAGSAADGGAAAAAGPARAAGGGDEGLPVVATPAKKRKVSAAADTPARGAPPADATAAAAAAPETTAPAAGALAAAGVASPGGARPVEEPWNVWIKDNPEFPPGSGKYPFYLKKGPMSKLYYTISVGAGEALLDDGHDNKFEGGLVLQDAETGRSWEVQTSLKRESSKGQQRYITRTSQFNRDNNLQVRRRQARRAAAGPAVHTCLPACRQRCTWHASLLERGPTRLATRLTRRCCVASTFPGQPHDVLWLQRGPRRDCLLFGIWRWGSREAADFAAKLAGTKRSGGK